jgi:predicted nuclease with TOPRIM domain
MSTDIHVPISPGELIDKITILQIKSDRMQDPAKLANVRTELELLEKTWRNSPHAAQDIEQEWAELRRINEALWDIEDKIRDKEREKCFDQEFIELARSVYITNDERAAVKRAINTKLGSRIVEEKSYAKYR